MSILIKGMDMPSNCIECPFCDGEYGTCDCMKDCRVGGANEKPGWCPLEEVPDLQQTCNQLATDCISRHDAIDMFQRLADDSWNQKVSTTWANAYSEAVDFIEELPSAQPEVIRCKDCRYYYKDIGAYQNIECQCDNWYTGTLTGDLIGVGVEPYDDFFCGFAERREDEQND